MSERLTDLPEWVWQMVERIQQYEDEHPKLFRETEDGYSITECLGLSLEQIIPPPIWQAGEVMRARAGR
jgi:hypothetical protein